MFPNISIMSPGIVPATPRFLENTERYHSLQQIKDKGAPSIIQNLNRIWRHFPGLDCFFSSKVEKRVTQAPLLDFLHPLQNPTASSASQKVCLSEIEC